MAQNWALTRRKRMVLGVVDAVMNAVLWPIAALRLPLARLRDGHDPLRILVLEFWQLGDAVMAEPFLRELRRRFPDAEISLLCKAATRTLLSPSRLVDRFFIADVPWTAFERKYAWQRYRSTGFLALMRQLRAERFDVTVDARMDLRSNLLTRAIGARRRVGFDAPGGRVLLTDRVSVPAPTSHKVEDWLAMLAPLGGPMVSSAPRLAVDPAAAERAERLFSAAGIDDGRVVVAIHPSARNEVRQWPLSRFAAVVEALVERGDVHVLMIEDPNGYGAELGRIQDVTVVRPALQDLAAQLARCDLFIGNDSGPAHIAAAVGVRTITIFGPGAADWYRPYGADNRVLQLADIPCRPCFDMCTQPENFCITGIGVSSVLSEVNAAIDTLLRPAMAAVDLMPTPGEIPA